LIFENIQISNLNKFSFVGAELVHVEGRTDRRTEGQTDMKS